MKKRISLLLILLLSISAFSQNVKELRGTIVDATTNEPMPGVSVMLHNNNQSTSTNNSGEFVFQNVPVGDNILVISSPLIETLRMPVGVQKMSDQNLGKIAVKSSESRIFTLDSNQILASMDESSLDDESDMSSQNISTLALLSNDPYLTTTSFQFSPARFRNRGYASKYERTFLNGVEFNDQIRGSFNYSMIGAMNDMTRAGNALNNMQPGSFTFGSIGGSQDINLRAGNYAKGKKITGTFTNRNYKYRAMASYSTGLMDNGWAFSGLVGGRYADEGVVEGTFYNNFSYFLALEKQWNGGKHSLSFTTFGSPVQRAQQSANTKEAVSLMDNNQYNSYWGYMPDGTKRNSRIVTAFDPTAIASYIIQFNRNTKLTNGLSFRYSRYGSTALSWFKNEKDPRPDYYRNMPSYFYLNGLSTNSSEQYYDVWTSNNTDYTQVNWYKMYEKNFLAAREGQDEKARSASYIVEERRNDLLDGSFNSTLESKLSENITLNAGIGGRSTKGMTFSTVNDLLGAPYLIDVDKYGERDFKGDNDTPQNDLNNPNRKVVEGDRFGYDYNMFVNSANTWFQAQHDYNNVNVYYGAKLTYTDFVRKGNMRNGRNPNNSYGYGKHHTFMDQAIKAGFVYKLDGRNFIVGNIGYQTQAPLAYDAYMSPRVSDKAIPNLESERIANVDLGYTFSYPRVSGRIAAFQTNFYDKSIMNSYYSDVYGTYIHLVMTDANTIHRGVELGLIWKATNNLTLSFGGTVSENFYANRPLGTVSYENNLVADASETVYIKNFYVGGSPQTAGTIGIDYFYKYWFFGANINAFANSYLAPSPIQRTASAVATLDIADQDIYEANLEKFVKQQKLHGGSTLDLSVGKLLYLKNGQSLNFNLSVNNVLNYKNLQTGGYEQGRFDTTNMLKFAPKYYYMQGINCFFNASYRFR
ncbi:MAG: carboxypeptidase-like regulatory domain-containing protein [Dysgonomonas sp.]